MIIKATPPIDHEENVIVGEKIEFVSVDELNKTCNDNIKPHEDLVFYHDDELQIVELYNDGLVYRGKYNA